MPFARPQLGLFTKELWLTATPASRGDGPSYLQGVVYRVSEMVRSSCGLARPSGRARTDRSAIGPSDRHVAHGDASAHSTDPNVPPHAPWCHDQQWGDC